MTEGPTCVYQDGKLLVNGREYTENLTARPKPGARWYISFYHDAYRHWANWVTEGIPFTARRTRDYQYPVRSSRAQEIRMERGRRASSRWARQHGKSMY